MKLAMKAGVQWRRWRCGQEYPTGTYSQHKLTHPQGVTGKGFERDHARDRRVIDAVHRGETITQIANEMGVSRQYVSEVYQRVTGTTVAAARRAALARQTSR